MHRHDAHEVAARGRERARRLLRSLHRPFEAPRRPERTAAAIALDALGNAERLEHVPGDGLAFRTPRLEARKPPGIAHDLRHDLRKRPFPDRTPRAREQPRGGLEPLGGTPLPRLGDPAALVAISFVVPAARKRHRDPAKALGYAAAPVEAAPFVVARRQRNEVIGRKRKHIARQHLEQRRRVRGVRERVGEPHHRADLGRLVEHRSFEHDARKPARPQRVGEHARVRHRAEQHRHIACGMSLAAQRRKAVGDLRSLDDAGRVGIDPAAVRVRHRDDVDARA